MDLLDALHYTYAQRALVASLLVGLSCGLLGCFILLRNMALVGDALSHAVLPGVVVGFVVAGYSLLAFFLGAVLAGLLAAVLITLIQRKVYSRPDAAIGIVFTVLFASGVMGISELSHNQGVHLDMKDFLFGNVLGITPTDLYLTGAVASFVLLSLVVLYRYFFITTFQPGVAQIMGISSGTMHYFLMLLLSFAVVAALQSVGVILVVALLIIPASTAYLLTDRLSRMLPLSAALGMASAAGGLLLALGINTTPGPAMTLVSAGFYLLAVLFSPKRGALPVYLRRRIRRSAARS